MLSRNIIFFTIIFCITLCCASQNDPIKTSDLIGTYVLEIPENPQNKEEFIFKKKEQKSHQSSRDLVLLYLAEHEFSIVSSLDVNNDSKGYDWHYNENTGTIKLQYSNDFLNALKENDSELFLNISEKKRIVRMELEIFHFKKGGFGLKILDWK